MCWGLISPGMFHCRRDVLCHIKRMLMGFCTMEKLILTSIVVNAMEAKLVKKRL